MADDRRRFEKIVALAINPGAVEGEAIAAFRRARELVVQNPSLAHPLPSSVPATLDPPPQATFKVSITDVHPDWILILVGLLSKTGYGLNLKQKIEFDFSRSLTGSCGFSTGSTELLRSARNDEQPPSPTVLMPTSDREIALVRITERASAAAQLKM